MREWAMDSTFYLALIVLLLGVSTFLVGGIKKYFPKLFLVISSAKVTWPAAICFNLIDGLITWIYLARDGVNLGMESNPLVRFVLQQLGIGNGLIAHKAIITIFILILLKIYSPFSRTVLAVVFFLLCVNNFLFIFFAGRWLEN